MSAYELVSPLDALGRRSVFVAAHPPDPVAMPGAQQVEQRHDASTGVCIQTPVVVGQSIPGHGGTLMVRIVETEIQYQQVEHWVFRGYQVRVGVVLLIGTIAGARRHRLVRLHEELLEGMVERIE